MHGTQIATKKTSELRGAGLTMVTPWGAPWTMAPPQIDHGALCHG